MTNGGYGVTMKNDLLKRGHYRTFIGNGSERSVLSAGEVETAKAFKREKELVAYLTPFFQAICNEITLGLTVINSENIAWLPTRAMTSNYNLKPDIFAVHLAMAQLKRDEKRAMSQVNQSPKLSKPCSSLEERRLNLATMLLASCVITLRLLCNNSQNHL
jgi:hypothetical protein